MEKNIPKNIITHCKMHKKIIHSWTSLYLYKLPQTCEFNLHQNKCKIDMFCLVKLGAWW